MKKILFFVVCTLMWALTFADKKDISEAGGAIIGGASGYQAGEISKLPPTITGHYPIITPMIMKIK